VAPFKEKWINCFFINLIFTHGGNRFHRKRAACTSIPRLSPKYGIPLRLGRRKAAFLRQRAVDECDDR
jgi:hypothetical protein